MTDALVIETPASGVRLLRLNRPEKRNALATPLLDAVASALEEGDADNTVRVFVLTGGDKVFAAGADINEMAQRQAPEALADERPGIWARIRKVRKPMIAAVEGWCLGAGNELLMCCDLAVASEEAKFGQPETNLGIIPGAGGSATLSRLVGRSAAMKMVLTGKPISAREALNMGLVAYVSATGAAISDAVEIATDIATRAPLAMQQAKAVVKAAFDFPHEAHLGLERQAFSLLFGSDDKREGVAAFLEKRKPEWTGR